SSKRRLAGTVSDPSPFTSAAAFVAIARSRSVAVIWIDPSRASIKMFERTGRVVRLGTALETSCRADWISDCATVNFIATSWAVIMSLNPLDGLGLRSCRGWGRSLDFSIGGGGSNHNRERHHFSTIWGLPTE